MSPSSLSSTMTIDQFHSKLWYHESIQEHFLPQSLLYMKSWEVKWTNPQLSVGNCPKITKSGAFSSEKHEIFLIYWIFPLSWNTFKNSFWLREGKLRVYVLDLFTSHIHPDWLPRKKIVTTSKKLESAPSQNKTRENKTLVRDCPEESGYSTGAGSMGNLSVCSNDSQNSSTKGMVCSWVYHAVIHRILPY